MFLLVALLLALLHAATCTVLVPGDLRVDFIPSAQAVIDPDSSTPEFSWISVDSSGDATRALVQVSYEVQVSIDASFASLFFDSGIIEGNITKLAINAVAALPPDSLLYWRVRIAGSDDGAMSAWVSADVLRGLASKDFTAQWIAPTSILSANAPVRLRAVVSSLPVAVARATAYIASPCYWHLYSNGAELSPIVAEMGPYTVFESRILYSAIDITDIAKAAAGSAIALGARLAPGPYGEAKFGFPYTGAPLLLEVRVVDADGITTVYASGTPNLNFTAHLDPITWYSWYGGEVVDAALDAPLMGWDSPAYNESGRDWEATAAFTGVGANALLTPLDFAPITRVATLVPIAISSPSSGIYTFSFAQNFAGFVELDVPTLGTTGVTITLNAGELILPDGHVFNQLNSSTNMTLVWTLQGPTAGPLETIRPSFSFWAFQHVEVSGWPASAAPPSVHSVRGIAISTIDDAHVTGRIESFGGIAPSASIANAYHHPASGVLSAVRFDSTSLDTGRNVMGGLNCSILAGVFHATVWSQRNNFQSIPSDCPNREKRGWMGDGAVSVAQAVLNFNLAAEYRSWLRSMRDDQDHIAKAQPGLSGLLSSIVPNSNPPPKSDDASWAVAIAEVTSQVVSAYNDTATLLMTYPAIRSYLAFLGRCIDPKLGIMVNQSIWGDWDAAFPRADYVPVTAPVCATANMMRIAQILKFLAPLAGHGSDVQEYDALLNSSVAPFNAYYALNLTNGTYVDGIEQTPALMALYIGFVPPTHIAAVQNWLINDVETTRGVHLSTGATGTRYLFEQLSSMGRTDLAAAVAAQDTFPSHGYWIVNGATTCWENWSGDADEQHPPPPTHDHIFLCSSSYWFYTTLLGIRQAPGAVGFSEVFMMPPLIDSLPSMAGSLNTIRGVFMLSWAWTGEPMASLALLNASIPANARASICVPVPGLASPIVKESGRIVWANGTFVAVPGIISGSADVAGYISFSVLSGNFSFAASDNHPAIVSKVHRLAVCSALWAKPQESSLNSTTNYGPLRLECPSTLFLSHVVRAGIIDGSRIPRVTTDALYAAVPTVPGVIRHRYLVTHALERLCISPQAEKRQHSCHVGADELAQAVYPVISENDVTMELCAVALCS